MSISEWSPVVSFTTKAAVITTPSIVSPINGTTGLPKRPTFTSSAYSIDHTEGGTHLNSDWQVSSDTGFTNILVQGNAVTGTSRTSWTPSSDINTETVYVRVRYRSSTGVVSDWSATRTYGIQQISPVNTPNITSPINGTTDLPNRPTFTSSAFSLQFTDGSTHLNSDWQVASDTSFTNILVQGMGVTGTSRTSWTPGNDITTVTVYVRVRYRSSNGVVSDWSATRTYGIQQISPGDIIDGNYVLGTFNGNYILVGDDSKRHSGRTWGPNGISGGVFGTTVNNGVFNTDRMLSITSGDSRVNGWVDTQAFQYVRGVHPSGYLPSELELTFIYNNRSSLPSDYNNWGSGYWWGSTEHSSDGNASSARRFSDGHYIYFNRGNFFFTIQVRRIPV